MFDLSGRFGFITTSGWPSLHVLVTLLALGIYLTASRTLCQRRHPSAAIAWILSLTLLPYVALPLYFLFGNRKVVRPQASPLSQFSECSPSPEHPNRTRLQNLASTIGLPGPSSYDHFELHEDGVKAKLALISTIQSAISTLDLCSFMFSRDVLGQEITHLLIQKALSGVRVRLMIDGIGIYLGLHPDLHALKEAGVLVTKFIPLFRSTRPGRTNLRNHRKMVIADARRLWIGGRNFAAEYFEGDNSSIRKKKPWIDLSFELHGAIAMDAQRQFERDWAFANQSPVHEATQPLMNVQPLKAPSIQWVPSGPDQAEDTYYTLLVSSCFSAQSRILAVSPYFVPDPTLQMAITLAARRGIAVDLIVPRKSNHRLANIARHNALRELTAAGAKVWLHPEMIHAKAVVIDEEVAFAGTANLDERSMFLNFEVMVAFYDQSDVNEFAVWIKRYRDHAEPYRIQKLGIILELGEGLVRWLAFQL